MNDNQAMDINFQPVEVVVCRDCSEHLDASGMSPFTEFSCPKCNSPQTVPARFGGFLLLELLGRGGMGTVYKALDEALNRLVAIKVMQKSLSENPSSVENFLREAQSAAALNHRHVVQIYSCGQEYGQVYIAMELVGGGRLDKLLEAGNPLDEARILQIGEEVALGLEAANDLGLVHGDIKPENILFDNDGLAKVVDFGLARFVHSQQPREEIWGTPFYIAPEKVKKQKEDHRADIYSLGATLFHGLTGQPPFDAPTAKEVVLDRLKKPAPDPAGIVPTLQSETSELIKRMLELEPNRRYPTYKSLLADLRKVRRIAKENRGLPGKQKDSNPGALVAVFAGIFLLLLGLVGAGLWWIFQEPKEDAETTGRDPNLIEKTVIRNGQLFKVLVPRGDGPEGGSSMPAGSGAPRAEPFSPGMDKRIAGILRDWKPDRTLATEQELQKLVEKLPESGLDRSWMTLTREMLKGFLGTTNDPTESLQRLLGTEYTSTNDIPHPGTMMQQLARIFLGETIEDSARESWPAWGKDAAVLAEGLSRLRKGDLKSSVSRLDEYAAKEAADPQWAYAFQPPASHWVEQIQDWQTLTEERSGSRSMEEEKNHLGHLESFSAQAPDLFKAELSRMIEQSRAAIGEMEARQKQEEEEQRRLAREKLDQDIQKDLDTLDELRAKLLALMNKKSFSEAAEKLRETRSSMATEQGSKAASILLEGYEGLDKLHQAIITIINKSPVPASAVRDLKGDVVAAESRGLKVRLQFGNTEKGWDQINPRTYLGLASYVLGRAGANKRNADAWVALAFFCYEAGGYDRAVRYAQQALKLNPDVVASVHRLMPDVL